MSGTWKYIAAAAVLFVLVVGFMARPTPILGIDGGSLGASVGGDLVSCKQHADGEWICPRPVPGSSDYVDYRVSAGTFGCWSGEIVGRYATVKKVPAEISGCVSIVDHIWASVF